MEKSTNSSSVSMKQVIILLAILAVLGFGYWFYQRQMAHAPRFSIEPASVSLEMGRHVDMHAFFDPDGEGSQPAEDVTDKVNWSSEADTVAYVSNTAPTKGRVVAAQKGPATIKGVFNTYQGSSLTTVTDASLAITCQSIILKKAKVGQSVDFIALYYKWGVPDYSYVWTAPENQTSKAITPKFTFKTPGTKIVHVVSTDSVGTSAEADCDPLIVTQ